MDIANILAAVQEVITPITLLYLFLGVFFGIIAGAIPGFTFTMAIILAFPFTFGMDPIQGLTLMIGIYIGGLSGGLISGMLLGIPGTPSSVVTTFDGYPMAKSGQASRALGLGIFSSVIGTIFGALVLFMFGPIIARLSMNFGPWEIFSLIVFALTLVAGLSGNQMTKGMLAACIGLLVGTIGVAPTGQIRFDFDTAALSGGLEAIPVLIGLFALSQLLTNIEEIRNERGQESDKETIQQSMRIPFKQVFKDFASEKINVVRSSLLGCFIGALPAAGAESANFISYDRAKKAAQDEQEYGKGHPGGIIAAETSNNAVAGGAFIPTITLGIPGDVAQAVMIGALILHGITPGPALFDQQPVLVNSIYVAIIFSAVAVLIIQVFMMPLLARITLIPKAILVPSILVLTTVGAFALNNRPFDIWVVLVFGIIGYLLTKMSVPLAPVILGLILGPTLEAELFRALQINSELSAFITRPISLIFLILAAGSIYFSFRAHQKRQLKESVT